MSEAVAAPVTPAAPPTREASIHDAIESLFSEKEKAPVVAAAPAEEAPTETPTEPPVEGEAVEAAPEVPAAAPAPKVSASDHAIQVAKAKRKLASIKAAAPAPVAPSPSAIATAAAIEAAGGDPLKVFKAAGLDLAAVVRAHENEMAANPEYADPLAKEVKTLAAKLAQYEERDKAAKDEVAVGSFFAAAEKLAKAGDKFEYVAAQGQEGLELVKELVLEAAKDGQVLPLGKALEMAESHYSAEADKLAKTKKLASKFQAQTRKPGLAQQAPAAGAAPATQTKTRSLDDVISQEIDALLG